MKKQMKTISVLLLTVLLCVGCSSRKDKTGTDSDFASVPNLAYSNLTDRDTQQQIAELLEEHGVTEDQTSTLMFWADDFNGRVTSRPLPTGFTELDAENTGYRGLIIKNKEGEDGMIFPEVNCRLNSFLLMKNLIETNGIYMENDPYLIFDLEAIDTYEPFHMNRDERSGFTSLFSCVSVAGADMLEEHKSRINETWQERNLHILGDEISLVSVYIHSPFDQVRFIGHTGVLLEVGDSLLFVEKYGPQFPFQATKFKTRQELKDYLLGRADLYGDETELPPIVMENDRFL